MNKIKTICLALVLCISTSFSKDLEIIAQSDFPMNGVSVSKDGRVFVSMPQWTSKASPSLGEIINGKVIAYPGNKWNLFDEDYSKSRFMNVNAVHYDGVDSIWVVDYAAPFWKKTIKGAQKLVQININTNKVVKVYRFDETILPKNAKLNDVRVDRLNNVAYLSEFGIGAIIVLDLKTAKSKRVLDQHYSTKSNANVITTFEGKEFSTTSLQVNDIELSNDKKTLFYQATGGPILWQIKTKYLRNNSISSKTLENYVDVYSKSMTIGGMTIDKDDNLYLGSVQDNAVIKISKNRKQSLIIQDKDILWPDAMSIDKNNNLYIPAPQLKLLPKMNNGIDLTRKPFKVFKTKL